MYIEDETGTPINLNLCLYVCYMEKNDEPGVNEPGVYARYNGEYIPIISGNAMIEYGDIELKEEDITFKPHIPYFSIASIINEMILTNDKHVIRQRDIAEKLKETFPQSAMVQYFESL